MYLLKILKQYIFRCIQGDTYTYVPCVMQNAFLFPIFLNTCCLPNFDNTRPLAQRNIQIGNISFQFHIAVKTITLILEVSGSGIWIEIANILISIPTDFLNRFCYKLIDESENYNKLVFEAPEVVV